MFSLLLPRRRRSASVPVSFRPQLESLERRVVPSSLTLNVGSYGTGTRVTLSGHLSDTPNPANHTINLSGKVSGSTITNSNGDFQTTLVASALGVVTATDNDGTSNSPQVTLLDVTPDIQLTASEGPAHMWTFSGHVDYRCPEGLTVYFTGTVGSMQGKTTTVDANGDFTFCQQLSGTANDNGYISCYVVTPWGTSSTCNTYMVSQTGVS